MIGTLELISPNAARMYVMSLMKQSTRLQHLQKGGMALQEAHVLAMIVPVA